MPTPTPTSAITLDHAPSRRDFSRGLSAPFDALSHLRTHPRLWTHTLVAAAIHVSCFALVAWQVVSHADDALAWVWRAPEGGVGGVVWIVLLWLLRAVFLVGSYLSSALLAQIVVAPLNDRLSEKVERAVIGGEGEPFAWGRFAGDVAQGVAHSLMNLGLLGALMALTLPLHLIPMVGSMLASAAALSVTATFAAVEFTDWPQARRRMSWLGKWRVARREWRLYLGLGLGLHVMLAVPILNLLLLPVAVTAGTLVFCGLDRAGRSEA